MRADNETTVSHDDERHRFLMLFSAVLLPMFLAAVDQTLLAMATPRIGREFGRMEAVSWLAVAYLLASVVLVPLYGRLADRFGRRRLLGVALGVFTSGSVACLLAPSIETLVLARALQGAGGAGMMSLSQALIGEVLRPRERARYQGYFAIVFASASLVGPLLGGVVVQLGDWRWLFAANLPLCAFAGWRLLRLKHVAPPLQPTLRIDVRGGLLFALTAGLSLWLISRAGGVTMLAGWSLVSAVCVAALLWMALWRIERRTTQPYLPLELLQSPVMRDAALATTAYAAAMFSLVFYLPAYLQTTMSLNASQSGLLLLPLTGGIIVGSTVAGKIVVVTGRTREPPMGGLSLAAVSLLLLGLLPPSRVGVCVLGATTGIGLGMVMSVAQIITQMAAGPQRLGAAAALLSLARNLGAAAGAAAFGAIAFGLKDLNWALFSRSASSATGAGGYHAAFVAAGVVCLLGARAASRLPSDRLPRELPPN